MSSLASISRKTHLQKLFFVIFLFCASASALDCHHPRRIHIPDPFQSVVTFSHLQGVAETLIPDIDLSNAHLEGYDWANEMQYLQRSSEHGSDGEIYIPDPTQQDEMKRVYLRRLYRQREEERADESPRRTPRSTAAASGTVIIAISLSTAPSANSLLPKTHGTKHSLAVTDENPAKRRRF
ncbi:hypothetical protein C8J57DRAFT_1611310 [Mycena rebaudengoi]|nr:hypothetical protein C8J57DRAFT_1611310 [Mycena rebaudengoi]